MSEAEQQKGESRHKRTRVRRTPRNALGQEAQHFLLTSAAVTLTPFEIASMSEDDAYESFKAIRFSENDGKPFCPHCGYCEVYDLTTRRKFKCAACRRQFSVTSGTVFASRKMLFKKILYAIAVFVNGVSGVAALRLRREIGCSYKTGFVMEHKLREAWANSRSSRLLSGEVEVDGVHLNEHQRKATLRKHEGRRNQSAERYGKETTQIIVAARERGVGGESRVTVVMKDESHGSKFVLDSVAEGVTLISDEGNWSAAFGIHERKTVKHSTGFLVDGVHTNGVESLFSRMRRLTRGVHYKVRGHNLDLYAQEVSWREDYRRLPTGEQWRVVVQATTHQPISRRWKGYWQRWQGTNVVRRRRALKSVI